MEIHQEKIACAVSNLTKTLAQLTENGELYTTQVEGLSIFRRNEPSEPVTGTYDPSICIIAQGAKKVQLGNETYTYDTSHYLLTGIYLPVTAQVIEASEEKPYLGIRLTFEHQDIAQLLTDGQLPPPRTQQCSRGMATGAMTESLVSNFQRLVELLNETQDIPILAPLIKREILYRLLTGEQGARLRKIAILGTQSQQISKAISWLKENFTEPLRIDELAQKANMGTSTFHHHFRKMTALSPLQYQKQLRLQRARHLMLGEHIDAASAAFQVGYESPSQFSREYSRMYGTSPMRDIANLRQQSQTRQGIRVN